MKIIKRIMTLFLIVTMLVCPVNQALASDDGLFVPERELLLQNIGVISADNAKLPGDDVSRIEIIKAASWLTGYDENMIYNVDLPYTDILPGYEQENVLNFAYSSSLISYSDKIMPEETADLNFAARTFINAMGYDIVAKANGSYYSVSIYKDLMRGVNTNSNKVTYSDLVNMLYNMLFIDYLDVEFYTSIGQEYGTINGVSVYSHFHDIYTVKGRMESSSIASVTGTLSHEGYVTVDGKNFAISDNSFMLYVGNEILGVYRKTDDNNNLIGLIKRNEKELVVSADSFISYSNYRLEYQNEKGRVITAPVNQDAVILYNGQHITSGDYSDSLFKIYEGNITLIDTGNGYNVVCINSYDNILVKMTMVENDVYSIYDEIDPKKNISVDLNKDMYISVKNSKGENVTLDDIKTGNLVTYQRSLDGRFLNAYISETKVVGEIKRLREYETGRYEIECEGNTYNVTSSIPEDIKISLNTMYVCYINHFGNVGAIRYSKTSEGRLGYLIYREKGRGLAKQDEVYFKMLTGDIDEDGYTVLTGATKMSIDGRKNLTGQKAVDALDKFSKVTEGKSDFEPIPVIYTVNEAGRIVTVDTPFAGQNESTESLTKRHSLTDSKLLVKNMSGHNGGYTYGLKYYTLDESMHVGYDTSNPGEYYICDYPNEEQMNLELYSIGNKGGKCVFAVGESTASATVYEKNLALITSVTQTLNEKDEEVMNVKLMIEGKQREYFTKPDSTIDFSKVNPGDVTRISIDPRDRIIGISTPVFSYTSLTDGVMYSGTENYNVNRIVESRYVTGTVHSIEYDEQNGRYFLYYFITDPSDLSILLLRDNINVFVEKHRNDKVDAKVINGSDAISTVKGYDLFKEDADLVVIRYTYWVPSYSYIVRR